jgi:hypothetical protein
MTTVMTTVVMITGGTAAAVTPALAEAIRVQAVATLGAAAAAVTTTTTTTAGIS